MLTAELLKKFTVPGVDLRQFRPPPKRKPKNKGGQGEHFLYRYIRGELGGWR